jgi:hypothetical protein
MKIAYYLRIRKNSTVKSQHICTVFISNFSSGECTPRKVGPYETISKSGYFSRRVRILSRREWLDGRFF